MREFIIVALAVIALIVMVRVVVPSAEYVYQMGTPKTKVTFVGPEVDFDTNLGEEIDMQLKLLQK